MTYALTTPYDDLPFQSKQAADGSGILFVKNPYVGYLVDNTSATRITDVDYPSWHDYSITGITRSGTTATATTSVTHTIVVGNTVIVAGADQTDYNGTFTVTGVTDTTFTYEVANSPTTPATGTITAQGGKTTVPGLVYLNDYFFVQDADTGDIYNCDASGAYSSWNALGFITPAKEPSRPVYLTKSLDFVVSLKEWDTEFFYDAAVAGPASPLLPSESSYIKIGCASAGSVVEFDGGVAMITKRDKNQRSREVHVLSGLTMNKISTPAVERILNLDDLSTVYALYLSTAGHHLYVLTLKTSEITIVYDFVSKKWSRWTSLTAQTAQTLSLQYGDVLSQSEGIATAIIPGHGFSDGDPVTFAGADQSGYNLTTNVSVVDENTVTYFVDSSTVSPATGTITATGYNASYFPGVSFANYQNLDLVLHETNGKIYSLDAELFTDDGVPIDVVLRTPNWDAGNNKNKPLSNIRIIGDLIDSDVFIRYSKDDYQNWSSFRRHVKSLQSSSTRRLGIARRRAFEIRHSSDTHFRAEAIEADYMQGSS